MAHRTARPNVFGRELLVGRVLVEGWTVSTAARAQGISRATGYKWVRRFRTEGRAGLVDRSSRPRRSPRSTPAIEVERIVRARRELRWGPDRLGPYLGHPASTVAAVLRRTHMPRLADIDRPTGLPTPTPLPISHDSGGPMQPPEQAASGTFWCGGERLGRGRVATPSRGGMGQRRT